MKYLLIKAFQISDGDFDIPTVAVLVIKQDFIDLVEKIYKSVKEVTSNIGIPNATINIYNHDVYFINVWDFKSMNEDPRTEDRLEQLDNDLQNDEFIFRNDLPVPFCEIEENDTRMEYCGLNVDSYGNFWWNTCLRHTSIQIETSMVDIKKIKEAFNAETDH